MVSFWVHGMWADAAGVWKFMSVSQRQAALDVAHSHGAQILLAGGGATDGIEGYSASIFAVFIFLKCRIFG